MYKATQFVFRFPLLLGKKDTVSSEMCGEVPKLDSWSTRDTASVDRT